MANRFKGEVDLDVDVEAGGTKYRFRLDMNDLINLQDEMGLGEEDDEKFLERLENIKGLRDIRRIVRAGLVHNHPETTDEAAGELVSQIGVDGITTVIEKALRWLMPDPEPGPASGKGRRSRGGRTS